MRLKFLYKICLSYRSISGISGKIWKFHYTVIQFQNGQIDESTFRKEISKFCRKCRKSVYYAENGQKRSIYLLYIGRKKPKINAYFSILLLTYQSYLYLFLQYIVYLKTLFWLSNHHVTHHSPIAPLIVLCSPLLCRLRTFHSAFTHRLNSKVQLRYAQLSSIGLFNCKCIPLDKHIDVHSI